jgi:hypothetical protein
MIGDKPFSLGIFDTAGTFYLLIQGYILIRNLVHHVQLPVNIYNKINRSRRL